jgi:beta-lactamase class A
MINIFKIKEGKFNHIWKLVFIFIGLLIGLIIGVTVGYEKSPDRAERHQSGYSHISPLLECVSNKSDSPNNSKLQNKIEDLISERLDQKKITNASVYFRDLANGPWIGINENEKFTPASLLKVPILITYYKVAETNPAILKEKVLIDNSYQNTTVPNIVSDKKTVSGQTYSIEELLEYMIIESDNQAANTLLNKILGVVFVKTYDDLGLDVPSVETPENYMSVKNYASFFRVLYNASYLDRYYSEKALELLSKSKYKAGLAAGVPSEVEVAHKFGERRNQDVDQLHDCGIIYKQNKDYLLCVMTRGQNFDDLSLTIKDISELVYQNVN